MIKYLNNDEIRRLKFNLYKVIRYKKVYSKYNSRQLENFQSGKSSFEEARDIYLALVFQDNKESINKVMLEYISKTQLLEGDSADFDRYTVDTFKKQDYEGSIEGIEIFFETILCSISKKYYYEYSFRDLYDILLDDKSSEFSFFKQDIEQFYGEPLSESIMEDIFFNGEYRIYCFKDFQLSNPILNVLNLKLSENCQIFNCNNNLYIQICDDFYVSKINIEIILILTLSLSIKGDAINGKRYK